MTSLLSRIIEYKIVSVVGMAKNAGKTTALNYIIEEAMDEGIILGITSTGRDGEMTDLVTGTEKPRVFLDTDTIVAVPVFLFDMADASLEVLKRTNYSTALGDLLICRVKQAGYVQIAGPVINSQQRLLCEDMLRLGAQAVLVDGAIDRKSIANPTASDAIILSSGAVISRKMEKVIEETAHVVELYTTTRLEKNEVRDIIKKEENKEKIIVIDKDLEYRFLEIETTLGSEASKTLASLVGDDDRYIYIPGAFTGSLLSILGPGRLKQLTFIVKDPTKIFISHLEWGQYKKRGLSLFVMDNIKIAAITMNPFAPAGYSFDNIALVSAMQDAVCDIPVVDVRM